MNVLTVTGNLGKNAEVKTSPQGKVYCVFSLAIKSGYGERAKTTWARCTLWGQRATGNLPAYLVKGAKVAVSGEFSLDEYQGQDGLPRSMLNINVQQLDLLNTPQQGQSQQPPQAQQPPAPPPPQEQYQQYQQQQGDYPVTDDDIPF